MNSLSQTVEYRIIWKFVNTVLSVHEVEWISTNFQAFLWGIFNWMYNRSNYISWEIEFSNQYRNIWPGSSELMDKSFSPPPHEFDKWEWKKKPFGHIGSRRRERGLAYTGEERRKAALNMLRCDYAKDREKGKQRTEEKNKKNEIETEIK